MRIHQIPVLFGMLVAGTCIAAEQDAVKAAFEAYKAAILAQEGSRAAELVTESTTTEYQKYIDWARTANRDEVKSLSMLNRMQVIIIRHRVPPEDLRKLDGKSAFAYAVDRDWIGKNGVIRTSIGEVEVAGNDATAESLVGGQKTPNRFLFKKEKGQWRFNLISVMQAANGAFQALAKQRGVSEDELIVALAESTSGKKVPESIWEPVK